MDDVVAAVTDVFFQARISSVARSAGRSVRYLMSDEAARGTDGFALALVDLDARIDMPGAIGALKAAGAGTVVAFGPHLDAEARKAAKRAGADRVLAKSRFVTELPLLMQRDDGVMRHGSFPPAAPPDTPLE